MEKKDKIISFIEKKYPLIDSEKWDKVGFSINSKKIQNISKVLICLDFSFPAFEKAIKKDIDLIITHHPFYFEELKEDDFKNHPYKKVIDKKFNEINPSKLIYSLHTNFDNNIKGTSFLIAKKLGYEKNIISLKTNQAVIVTTNDSIKNIIKKIKETFKFESIISNINSNIFEMQKIKEWKIAIFAGSGDISLINELKKDNNFNLLITSDLKWSSLVSLEVLNNLQYLIVPHKIEEVFIAEIEILLKKEFKNKIQIFSYYSDIKNFSF